MKGIRRKALKNNMNCLCNIFDNEVLWLVIIALILLYAFCGNDGYGCGCGTVGCGCGTETRTYNHGCC